ncbi:hypothetical protein N2152v2_004807 [Parachlorella kessleri]
MAHRQEAVDTVWKAAAYGEFEALKRLADANPQLLHEPDEQGYYAVQWAALNNRVAVLNYLIDAGCDVNAADRTGQTALHWTAVRGSMSALETLLRQGADVAAVDSRGYTLCHVAAQYGHTGVLYHLALKWGVDLDAPDFDGRTSLHWAAYKGFADTIRLLLVMGCRCNLADKEGCTPLHWAAIRGNAEACTVLLQGGADEVLQQADNTGATPSQLAIEKGHRLLGLNLAEYKYKQERASRERSLLARLHLSPIIWGLILVLLVVFQYKVLQLPHLPPPTSWAIFGSWLTFILAGIGLYFLYRTTVADPGFLPRGNERGGSKGSKGSSQGQVQHKSSSKPESSSEQSTSQFSKSLDSPALWAGQWNQLCVSCKIVRPLRAKHCSVTGRCVQCYDHYCPWVGNCVGKGNRHFFLIFLWLELGAIAASALVAVARIHAAVRLGGNPSGLTLAWPIMFIVVDVFLLLSVAALAIAQASQVVRNMTTNEMANWHRYKYLHDSDGDFHNPFDHGWRANCGEVCAPHRAPQAPYVLRRQESETMALLKMEQGTAGSGSL